MEPPASPSIQRQLRRAKRAKELSRDDKIAIRTLYFIAEWSRQNIAEKLEKTPRQVQLALQGPLTPRKNKNRKAAITKP